MAYIDDTPRAGADRAPAEIEREMMRLMAVAERLLTIGTQYEEALVGILEPTRPVEAPALVDTIEAPKSPIGRALDEIGDRLVCAADRLDSVRRRIAL